MQGDGIKRIWLIRHGQSMSQIDPEVSGVNPPLSPLGERQARKLRSRVQDLSPEVVYVSPLIRACRTFELSGLRGERTAFNKCLVESNWGRPSPYGDLCFDDLADLADPDASDRHLLDVRQRVALLVDDILQDSAASFVLFGHWGVFSELFKCFFGLAGPVEARALSENTAVSELNVTEEGVRQLAYWNDHGHVPL